MLAIAAAQASAHPPVVVVCINGFGCMRDSQISFVEENALIGITPPPRAFPDVIISGCIHQ